MNKPLAALAFTASLSLFAARPAFADDVAPSAAAAPATTDVPLHAAAAAPGATPALPPPAAEKTTHGWYGGQILLADLGGLALVGVAVGTRSAAPLGLAAIEYFAAAPLIHGLHNRPGAVAGSLALRVGVPLLAGAVGAGVGANSDADCERANQTRTHGEPTSCWGGALVPIFFAGIGMVVAEIIDATALSFEPAPTTASPAGPSSTGQKSSRTNSARVSLGAAPVRGGFTTGLAGTF